MSESPRHDSVSARCPADARGCGCGLGPVLLARGARRTAAHQQQRHNGDRRRSTTTLAEALLLLALLALPVSAVAAAAAAAAEPAEAAAAPLRSRRELLAAPPRAPIARPPAYCLYFKQSTHKACQGWQDAMCQYLNTTAGGCLASAISTYSQQGSGASSGP